MGATKGSAAVADGRDEMKTTGAASAGAATFFAGALLATFLATAFLTGAFLATAFLTGAFLATAFLTGAFLATAFFTTAFFATAFLTGAFLIGAFLAVFLTATGDSSVNLKFRRTGEGGTNGKIVP